MRLLSVCDNFGTEISYLRSLRIDIDGDKAGIEENLELIKSFPYDAIICDKFEWLLRIRSVTHSPIMMFCYSDNWLIKALSKGADDGLVHPINLDLLTARLHALVRRSIGSPNPVIEIGGARFHTVDRVIRCQDRILNLSFNEYNVAETLAYHAGKVVSHEVIRNRLYGCDDSRDDVVRIWICKLRKKLLDCGVCIRTVRQRGYMMEGAK
ncbi:response regulator transcription factor [Patescibacteria group bacterium]|nr:response regulator transcription factor [Patescibacteria group bacterium]